MNQLTKDYSDRAINRRIVQRDTDTLCRLPFRIAAIIGLSVYVLVVGWLYLRALATIAAMF